MATLVLLGTTILSVSASGGITLWDLGAARPLMSGPLGSKVETAVSHDGALVAKITGENSAKLFLAENRPASPARAVGGSGTRGSQTAS